MKKGFTLIELLIVVAIIAILAAIAVPNFLEAQTRAKIARVQSDMRTMNTAFETYRIDHNNIPPHGTFNRNANGTPVNISPWLYILDPILITTPIAYVSSEQMVLDAFQTKLFKGHTVQKTDVNNYVLGRLSYTSYFQKSTAEGGIISPDSKRVGMQRYGGWRLTSAGPDNAQFNQMLPPEGTPNSRIAASKTIPYDPSNGTISVGDIIRTGKGELQEMFI